MRLGRPTTPSMPRARVCRLCDLREPHWMCDGIQCYRVVLRGQDTETGIDSDEGRWWRKERRPDSKICTAVASE
ncbi:hypothetical protein VTO73DRAFT_6779 [Trametes versicolor]